MTDISQRAEIVRHFNRFYTKQIGVLQEKLLKSSFSLTEGRVLYELAHRETTTATELGRELGLDAGYLSRILHGFELKGLIQKQPSETDGRQNVLRLTDSGREAFARLDSCAQQEIETMLQRLSPVDQNRLVQAMQAIERLLSPASRAMNMIVLRPHRPGDMGWIVHRHGVLYSQEYGWDEQFEALVAEIVAKFIQNFDPQRERCWIAEKADDGEIVGSVFLVKGSDTLARLRLLYVEPEARGMGLGTRLVNECIHFARQAGYRKITLWTNDVLHAARHIYEKAGFRCVEREPHHSFGQDLVGENWELAL